MLTAPWHLVVREWVISLSLPIVTIMTIIFASNVIMGLSQGRNWRKSLWFQASVALLVLHLGVSGRNFWVFDLLHGFLYGENMDAIESRWIIDAISGLLTVVGGMCVIRIFTPDEWNAWPFLLRPWVAAGLATIIFVIAVHA